VVFECWVELAATITFASDVIGEEEALSIGTLVVRSCQAHLLLIHEFQNICAVVCRILQRQGTLKQRSLIFYFVSDSHGCRGDAIRSMVRKHIVPVFPIGSQAETDV
jgi:hypothetical protein